MKTPFLRCLRVENGGVKWVDFVSVTRKAGAFLKLLIKSTLYGMKIFLYLHSLWQRC